MTDIDEKIVEMRFQNEQFESGVKQSLSTLDKLKNALNFDGASDSLDELNNKTKNIDLSTMASGIEALQKRFSMFGTFSGRIVENLADMVTNKLGSAVEFIKTNIIQGGIRRSMNIEKARFQLETLLADEELVTSVMNSAMDSVDGTAYGFDVAAKSASMFAASGVEAGEEMDKSLMALADSTAAVNGNYEQMANIFSQIAGKGRLQGDEMLQLTNQGMNAAANIAKYYREVRNQTDMTEAKVREFASKGKISFQDFTDAMEWMYEGAAKKANETFDGAFANMKAALARIGQGFIQPFVEKNSVLVDLFNALRLKINDLKSVLVFDKALGNVDALSNKFVTFVSTITKNVTKFVNEMDLTKVFSGFYSVVHTLENVFQSLWMVLKPNIEGIGKFAKTLVNVDGINGFIEKIEEFTHKFNLLAREKEAWDKLTANKKKNLGIVNPEDLKELEDIRFKLNSLQKLFSGFWNLASSVVGVIKRLVASFKGMSVSIDVNTNSFFTLVGSLGDAMNATADFLNTSEGLQAVMNGISTAVNWTANAFKFAGEKAKEFYNWVKNLTVTQRIIGKISSGWSKVSDTFASSLNIIQESGFKGWFDQLSVQFQNSQNGFVSGIRNFTNIVKNWFNNIKSVIDTSQNPIVSKIREFINNVQKFLNLDAFKNAGTLISNSGFKTFFTSLCNDLEDGFPNIFEKLTQFKDKITEFIDWIKSFFVPEMQATTVTKEMSNFFGGPNSETKELQTLSLDDAPAYSAMDKFKEKVQGFLDWFKNVKSSIKSIDFGTIIKGITGLALAFAGFKTAKSISTVGNAISKFFDSIVRCWKSGFTLKVVTGIPDAIKQLGNALSGIQQKYKSEALLNVGKSMVAFAGSVLVLVAAFAVLSRIDFGSDEYWAVKVGIIAGFLILLIALAGTVSMAAEKWKAAKKAATTLEASINIIAKKIGTAANNFAKAAKYESLAHMMTSFAISVLAIVAAIMLIQKAANGPNFNTAIDSIVVIVLAIGAVVVSLAAAEPYINPGVELFKTISIAMLAMGSALVVMARAVDKFMGIQLPKTDKEIAIKFGMIAAVLVLLGGIVAVIGMVMKSKNGVDIYNSTALLGGIIGLTAMLHVTVNSLIKIMNMNIPEDYNQKMSILVEIFVLLIGVMIAVAGAGRLAGGTVKMGGTLFGLAILLISIMGTLVALALFPLKPLKKAIGYMTLIMAEISLFLLAAGVATRLGGGKSSWQNILALSVMIVAVVVALKVLENVPGEKLLKGALALGGVFLALSVALKATNGMSNNEKWKNTLAICGIVAVISVALYELADKDWQGIMTAVAGLCSSLLFVALAMKIMNGVKAGKDGVKMMVAEIGMLVAIGAALYALSGRDWKGVISGALGICGCLLAVSLAMKIISGCKFNASDIGAAIAGVLAIVAVGAVLYGLSTVGDNWPAMVAGALGIAACLIAASAAMAICSMVKPNLGSIASFALGIAGIWAIAEILKPFGSGDIDTNKITQMAIAICGTLLVMSIVMAICSLIGLIAAGTYGIAPAAGIAALDAFILNLQGMLVALGKLNQSEETKALVNGGIDALCKLGEGLGKFFGTIVDSFATTATSSLGEIGQNLSDFWEKGSSFFDGIKSLDEGSVKAAKQLVGVIALLTAEDLISNVTNWLKSKIFGDNNDFGDQLSKFGEAMGTFAEKTAELNCSEIENAAKAGQIIIDMCKEIPNSGGLLGLLAGNNDADDFGARLEKFATSLVQFQIEVGKVTGGLDVNKFETAKQCGMKMIELAQAIPNEGGLLGVFAGNNDVDEFGKKMESFASSLMLFQLEVGKVTGGLDVSKFTTAKECGAELVALAETIPNDGGVIGWIIGNNGLDVFGEQCAIFAERLKTFCINAADTDFTSFDTAVAALKELIDLAIYLGETGESGSSLMVFSQNLADMAPNAMANFIEAFNDADKAAAAAKSFVTSIKTALDGNLTKFRECGKNAAQNYLNAIKVLYPDATAIGTTLATNIQTSLEAKYEILYQVGAKSAQRYLDGFKSKIGGASSLGTEMAQTIIRALSQNMDQYYSVGEQIGQKFADGIRSKVEEVAAASAELAIAASSTGAFNSAISSQNKNAQSANTKTTNNSTSNTTNNYYNNNVTQNFNNTQSTGVQAFRGATKALSS